MSVIFSSEIHFRRTFRCQFPNINFQQGLRSIRGDSAALDDVHFVRVVLVRAGFFGFDEILSLEQNLVLQHCLSSTKLLQDTCAVSKSYLS